MDYPSDEEEVINQARDQRTSGSADRSVRMDERFFRSIYGGVRSSFQKKSAVPGPKTGRLWCVDP